MANDWRQAETVRAFLDAVTAKVPQAQRSAGLEAWLASAREVAEAIDPLREPARIARTLTPPT